jgi:hypothetical protein
MKNGVFWVVTPCGSCKNRRFGGTWRLHHQGDKNLCTRLLQEPHGVTTQKTPFFIVTAVKTSNLTQYVSNFHRLWRRTDNNHQHIQTSQQ